MVSGDKFYDWVEGGDGDGGGSMAVKKAEEGTCSRVKR